MSIKGLNKSIQVADLFSALSENYAQFSVIQQEVGQRMLARLEYINFKPSVIIDAACATGINSRKIAQIFPKATVHGLDISAGMLAQARKKRKWFSKQKFSQINFSQTAFEDNSVDFIFSNLALPWVSDMQLCLKEWQRILKPEGLLLFSTFGPDTLIELKQAIYRTAKDVKMINFIDMHDLGDTLLKSKFSEPVMDVENVKLIFSDMESLLTELTAVGVLQLLLDDEFIHFKDNRLIIENVKEIKENYQEHLTTNEQLLPVSWELIYGHAWGSSIKSIDAQGVAVQGANMIDNEVFILDASLKNKKTKV